MSAVPDMSPTAAPPQVHGTAGSRPAGPAGTRPAAGRAITRPPIGPTTWTAPGSRQHVEALARDFAVLFLEVESGRRPRRHLAKVMTPMLYARLSDTWVRGGCPGDVVRVTLLARERAHCDLIAIVRRGKRCGALSLRLLRVPGRGWLVDVVARPEDGELPPPAYPVLPDHSDDEADVIPPVTADAYAAPPDWLVRG